MPLLKPNASAMRQRVRDMSGKPGGRREDWQRWPDPYPGFRAGIRGTPKNRSLIPINT